MIEDPRALDPKSSRAMLLYSGGFDSTLVALLLKQRGIPTVALTVNYTTRPAPEVRSAGLSAAHLGFEKQVGIDLPFGDFRNNPELWPSQRHEAWFPYRNVIFFGVAAHMAIRHQCNVIAAGIRVWDDFDDASGPYLSSLEELLQHSGSERFSARLALFLPLLASHDRAIEALLEGGEAERILRETWSCWRSGPQPCGQCSPCRDRNAFFTRVEEMKKHPKP